MGVVDAMRKLIAVGVGQQEGQDQIRREGYLRCSFRSRLVTLGRRSAIVLDVVAGMWCCVKRALVEVCLEL